MEGEGKPGAPARKLVAAPAMVRCACTYVAFEEMARRLRGGQDLDEAQFETGVGLLCTACIPDLMAHLAAALPGRFS